MLHFFYTQFAVNHYLDCIILKKINKKIQKKLVTNYRRRLSLSLSLWLPVSPFLSLLNSSCFLRCLLVGGSLKGGKPRSCRFLKFSNFVCAGTEMTELSERLNYDREVIRVWFCNKRQALKNTIKKLKQEAP